MAFSCPIKVLFSKVEEEEKEEAVVKEEVMEKVEEDMEEEKTEGEKAGADVDQEPDVDEEGLVAFSKLEESCPRHSTKSSYSEMPPVPSDTKLLLTKIILK